MLTLRGPSGFRSGAALSDLGIIEDGAVLIRDGLIACVGTSRRVENLREARDAIEISAHGCVVLPAFVDQGLSAFVGDYRMKSLLQARVDASMLLENCLQHGSVSTEIEAGGTDSFEGDLRLIRQGSRVADNADVSLAWRISTDHARKLGNGAGNPIQRLIERGWVRSFSVSGSLARQRELHDLLCAASPPLGLRISRQIASLSDLGSRCERQLSVTVIPAGEEDRILAALAQQGTPALCRPLRDLLHPERRPLPLRDFIEHGGIPVLATAHHRFDSPSFSMQAAIALAVLYHGMTAEQAITAATNNAAWSLGWGRDRGTIEVGKRADLVVLQIDDFHEIPRRHGTNHAGLVVRRGDIVFNRTSWRGPARSTAAVAP